MRKFFLATIAILLVAVFVGCSKNNPPEISDITMSPADSIASGGTVALAVAATDPDNDDLTYAWSASGGTLSATSGQSVDWVAPSDTGHYGITVIAEDAEASDTLTETIKVYSPILTYTGQFTTPMAIYDNVLSSVGIITISGAATDAVVDSVELTVNISHSNPSYLLLYLDCPDDRYWTPWDGNYAGGQQTIMLDGTGVNPAILVNGDWELWVGVYAGGGDGTVNSWSITIYSH